MNGSEPNWEVELDLFLVGASEKPWGHESVYSTLPLVFYRYGYINTGYFVRLHKFKCMDMHCFFMYRYP